MTRRDPFQAIADPTRRAIIGLLAKETLNLNSVAGKFNVSRPAISKHIKILTQCGLIEINQKGRERFCEARLEKLSDVSTWLVDYRQFWDAGSTELVPAPVEIIESPVIEEPKQIAPVETISAPVQQPSETEQPQESQAWKQKKVLRKAKTVSSPSPESSTLQGSLFG